MDVLTVLLLSLSSSSVFAATFVTQPESLNTSLNSNVTFTCEATDVKVAILFYVDGTLALNDQIKKRGFIELGQETNVTKKKRQLLVHAKEMNNNTIIYCVNSLHTVRSNNATLTIQGLLDSVVDLNYTFINGSSVLLTWTAPYTLDNVPITGYYIVNGLVNITTTNNNTNYTLSTTNPDPCVNNVSVSPINDAGIGSSNYNISFYYKTIPLITPPVSVVPVINGQAISLNISVNVSKLCIGEYPNSIIVHILNTENAMINNTSIPAQVNDQRMIVTGSTSSILLSHTINTFIVNVSLSNNVGTFNDISLSVFGYLGPVTNINSSIDNCSTIDIKWTAPIVYDGVSIQYYILRIYDAIAGSLVNVVSVYHTSYQFVDDNLFINCYTYVITGVNELGGGIFNNATFSYQRVPRTVKEARFDVIAFNETIANVPFNIPVTLECTGEAPENATVTIQCNGTGVVYDNVTLVEKAKQPMNITGSVLVPLNQQCNITIVFSNEAGSSEPFILAFNATPATSPTTHGTDSSPTLFTPGIVSIILAVITAISLVL